MPRETKAAKIERAARIEEAMLEHYGKGESSLDYDGDPFRLVCAVVLSAVVLFLVPRQAAWRYYALLPVWGGAVLAAAIAFKFAAGDDSMRVPTRVHVAHIMLEKEEVPPSLTAETARAEVCKQKLAKRTIALQEQLLDAAKTNGTLKCAVRMTLLNKAKNLRQKTKERKANHDR